MAEITLVANATLDIGSYPRRSGRTQGAAGVEVLLRDDLEIASVIARRGQMTAVIDRMRSLFGIELPQGPQRIQNQAVTALGIGPGRWMMLREGESFARLPSQLSSLASVCGQSSAYAVFRIAGPDARKALAKGVPIDLHPKSFGPKDCAVTQIAHIGAIIWQTDTAPVYEIAVFRSYAGSFWHWLESSAAEFGIALAL